MLSQYNISLYGILYDCPYKDRCQECTIKKIEDLSFNHKLCWFESLSTEEKNNILRYHTECFNKRSKIEKAD